MKRLTSLIFAVILTSFALTSCLRNADGSDSLNEDSVQSQTTSSTIKNIVTEETDAEPESDAPVIVENHSSGNTTNSATCPVSFYTQEAADGSYLRRTEWTTEFVSAKADGSPFDLAVFGLIPSSEDSFPAYAYRDVWTAAAEKAGLLMDNTNVTFTVSYQLKSGGTEVYEIEGPADAEKISDIGYIELYLYDDVHQEPGTTYSHLTEDTLNDWVVVTTVKVTAGEKIDDVEQIFLTARVTSNKDESLFGTSTIVIKRPADEPENND